MGLDTTHNAWHGPYSSFGDWRKKIAKLKGFNLTDMIGFGGDTEWSIEQISDPLYPLLNHSDCDGSLSPKECALIAHGLSEIIPIANATMQPDWDSHQKEEHYYFIELVDQFREGCIKAFKANESIEFH